MLQFLGRLIANRPSDPPIVEYLSKAGAEAVWRRGRLLAIDPQGASFEVRESNRHFVECLPWGSIAAVRVPLAVDGEGTANGPERRAIINLG